MKLQQAVGAYSIVMALTGFSGNAVASGFALITQSASGLGNAYAGGAASAGDASTIFFNPAGLSRLQGKQVVMAVHAIKSSVEFSDTGSSPATLGSRPLGTLPGDVGIFAVAPNFYFAMEVNPKMKFGLGVNEPFGQKTEYPAGWIGRFQALKSSVSTVNVNPSLSYQVSDRVSIGAGLDYQRINVELSSAKNLGTSEGLSSMSASDAAWGYNFGALFDLDSGGRIGVSYRSSIQYQLEGTIRVTNQSGTELLNEAVTADMKMPDTLSLSYFRALDDKWDVMADLSRTGWSSFTELRIIQVSNGASLQLTPENWKDTWRFSLGSNYHYNEVWSARIGVARDQSPVSDEFRTARSPDSDRTWLSFGGQYKPSRENAVDFGYAHLFVDESTINKSTGSAGTSSVATVGNLVGNYRCSADILSMQYTHSF